MKVLVTGITGQLGRDVMKELARRGAACVGATRREMPLTDGAACRRFLEAVRPGLVVHCAAYTAVDKAEEEPALCHAINGAGTAAIAAACRDIGAKLIYISTDYVFPGAGTAPYEIDAATGPLNVYGASKLAGEQAVRAALAEHFIVRVSWVFGSGGKNFIRTMLQLARRQDRLTVVADQVGAPTYTVDLARLLLAMGASDRYGTYHAANTGFCSWYELAVEVFRQRGMATAVVPVASSAYPVKAKRPHNSRLSAAALVAAGFSPLPPWQDAVERYLAELAALGE